MSGLDDVLGSEDLDYEYDLDEVQEKARLARASQPVEDENDSIDLGVEEKMDEDTNEEVGHIQPKHPAVSIHSRLGEKNEEVGHIQPKHPAGSIHSRLGPRNTPSEQNDYEQEESQEHVVEESQEHVIEESKENVNSEELERDDEDSNSLVQDEDDDDDDDDEDDDEDSRRTRFKSERKNISQNISLTTAKTNRNNIPDSLDDVIRGNYSQPRRGQHDQSSVFSRLQRPNIHQKGFETKNVRFRMNGPNDGIGSIGSLMDVPIYPVPNRPGWQSTFTSQDFTSDYCFENFGNTQAGGVGNNDLRYSIGTGGDVRTRLGGSVPNNQTGVTPVAGSQAGPTTPFGKGITPAGGQTTTSLKRPHPDDPADSADFVKQMKQEILHGKNAISLLYETFPKGAIKFFPEKQIGSVHLPQFECMVEVEGQIYKGLGKSKKLSKKAAADTALSAVMKTSVISVPGSHPPRFTTVTPENGDTTPLEKGITSAETGVTPVAASQVPKTTIDTPQNGTTTPLVKEIIPADAQMTTSLETPCDEDADAYTTPENEMGLKLPNGLNAISTLNTMYKTQIVFVDTVVDESYPPSFECSVEVEGEIYKGEAKQKKHAKKIAAELALLGLMQNWIEGKKPGPGAPQLVLKELMAKQTIIPQKQDNTTPQTTSDPQ